METVKYSNNLDAYSRRQSIEVKIGELYLGAHHPIRVQSMTTVDTMDTMGSVEQAIRMIEAGSELVRLTAPSKKEAENLDNIKKELVRRGYHTPLVADIHFTPNAAETAARIVEKVRINPGNYIDRKKFQVLEYTDAQYQEEVERIRDRFLPLINICKEHGTAMRIGTNHGSLSDRILSRYGDTPLGMVESALEFLRVCDDENYHNVVLSMKASNTLVMVQAYRLLVNKLAEEGLKPYPLHLGVTEAGEGEDGRIKSAVGIGTLLEDGLGDTVRVSLTEEPELEIPVARALVDRYASRTEVTEEKTSRPLTIDPFSFKKRASTEIHNLGGTHVPVVVADLSYGKSDFQDIKKTGHHYLSAQDKWATSDHAADYIYFGSHMPEVNLPGALGQIIDFPVWQENEPKANQYPMFTAEDYQPLDQLSFLSIDIAEEELPKQLNQQTVLILSTPRANAMQHLRRFIDNLTAKNIKNPVIIQRSYFELNESEVQLFAATDLGGLLVDGFGDGVMLRSSSVELSLATSFGTLQAARTRMTKTEYISCPSCGRTLFDLQDTTAMIRSRTDHLKGVKIGIMGCIVNGPGEMADADYGYVGSGPGKITLYKGQEVVKKGIPTDGAVDELIELIKTNGDWVEPELDKTIS